jgi:hypothetical protein
MKNIHVLPKQEQTKCYCGHTSYCDCSPEEPIQEIKFEDVFNYEKKEGLKKFIDNHKQETLEEAAERHTYGNAYQNFIRGAKWQQEQDKDKLDFYQQGFADGFKIQQERSYSEEEVIQLLIKFNQEIQEVEDVRSWFEQFKKK